MPEDEHACDLSESGFVFIVRYRDFFNLCVVIPLVGDAIHNKVLKLLVGK
jgi:hypothetical protein